ncbi:DUF4251 domain-containing protein [Mangrovimonas sp. YM274]|uniref:DUF4251 domain-containing protein n=1 Tax=Mangrovimonas sp. YM274 TaxID=3070660 RepID=UPI0027DAF5C1|nr:DUF4251 domain-containing protein [Mangrovimonas sp. YM274]WMI70316.1 DUF4251 domain-containing protein [Mangrovimonas sp. YM274]
MRKLIICMVLLCVSVPLEAQTKSEKKALKREQEREAFLKTKTLVEGEVFTFSADWATTQKGRRINLIGNPNFLRFDHGKIDADLPYFGVAQVAGYGSSSSGGVVVKGNMYNETKKVDEKKRRIVISFSVKNTSENFNMILTVYGNGNAILSVGSSNRNRISYDGKITESSEGTNGE